jgi:hypothetical protein
MHKSVFWFYIFEKNLFIFPVPVYQSPRFAAAGGSQNDISQQ